MRIFNKDGEVVDKASKQGMQGVRPYHTHDISPLRKGLRLTPEYGVDSERFYGRIDLQQRVATSSPCVTMSSPGSKKRKPVKSNPMRNIRTLFAPLIAAFLVACAPDADAPKKSEVLKIGLVDPQRAYKESIAGRETLRILADASDRLQNEVKELFEDSKKDKSGDAQKRFQEAQIIYRSIMTEEQRRLTQILEAHFLKTIAEFRQKGGYAVILTRDAAPAYDFGLDVTDRVIADMNLSGVDLRPPQLKERGNLQPSHAPDPTIDDKKSTP